MDEKNEFIPEEIADQQLSRTASWNNAFRGTNLASRARRAADQERIANYLVAQQAEAQANELRTSKAAQDLYFRSQNLNLQRQRAQAEMMEREQRMKQREELQPLEIRARENKLEADYTRNKSMASALALKERIAKQQADDDIAFQSTLNDALNRGVRVGSPEWLETVARARSSAPGMTSSYFDDVWKTTGTKLTPDEVILQAEELKKAGMSGSVDRNGVRVTLPVPKADATAKATQDKSKELDSLMEKWGAAKAKEKDGEADLEYIRYLEGRINGVRNEMGLPQQSPAEPQQAQPVAKQPTPAAPPVDRKALAQQALNDPNATEAHKAAARKILGL